MGHDVLKKLKWALIICFVLVSIIFYVCSNRSESETFSVEQGAENTETTDQTLSEEQDQKETGKIVIDICGAVKDPAVLILDEGSRVYQAIERAGGLTSDADISRTNQAAILTDGLKLYIPTKEEIRNAERTGNVIPYAEGSTAISTGNKTSNNIENGGNGKINVNLATEEELQKLNGVGPSTAQKIIAYRSQYGRFQKIEDLMNVSGIGEKTFSKWKNQICVE